MINRKKGLTAASLFAAASLASIAFTSQVSAQCVECAENPNSDPFTQGLVTRPSRVPQSLRCLRRLRGTPTPKCVVLMAAITL